MFSLLASACSTPLVKPDSWKNNQTSSKNIWDDSSGKSQCDVLYRWYYYSNDSSMAEVPERAWFAKDKKRFGGKNAFGIISSDIKSLLQLYGMAFKNSDYNGFCW